MTVVLLNRPEWTYFVDYGLFLLLLSIACTILVRVVEVFNKVGGNKP